MCLVLSCVLASSCLVFSQSHLEESRAVEVVVESIERVSHDEARFRLKISNRLDLQVFLAAYNLGAEPIPELLFIEHWQPDEGWQIVAPCMDTPPASVMKLNPGDTITLQRRLVSGRSAVCRVRKVQFEKKFRFRLEYFDAAKKLRTYLESFPHFEGTKLEAKPRIAVSETFKIPSPPASSGTTRRGR